MTIINMTYKTVSSKVYYLKISQKPTIKTEAKKNTSIEKMVEILSVEQYLKLYLSIGEGLNWLDRLFIEETELYDLINSTKTNIYKFIIDNNYAGYCELVQEDNYVEILYFGLIPDYIGKGYGNYFLRKTIDLAWSFSPNWIQLNTCDLDHPNALSTYIKAGFEHYKTIEEEKKAKSL